MTGPRGNAVGGVATTWERGWRPGPNLGTWPERRGPARSLPGLSCFGTSGAAATPTLLSRPRPSSGDPGLRPATPGHLRDLWCKFVGIIILNISSVVLSCVPLCLPHGKRHFDTSHTRPCKQGTTLFPQAVAPAGEAHWGHAPLSGPTSPTYFYVPEADTIQLVCVQHLAGVGWGMQQQ